MLLNKYACYNARSIPRKLQLRMGMATFGITVVYKITFDFVHLPQPSFSLVSSHQLVTVPGAFKSMLIIPECISLNKKHRFILGHLIYK